MEQTVQESSTSKGEQHQETRRLLETRRVLYSSNRFLALDLFLRWNSYSFASIVKIEARMNKGSHLDLFLQVPDC